MPPVLSRLDRQRVSNFLGFVRKLLENKSYATSDTSISLGVFYFALTFFDVVIVGLQKAIYSDKTLTRPKGVCSERRKP